MKQLELENNNFNFFTKKVKKSNNKQNFKSIGFASVVMFLFYVIYSIFTFNHNLIANAGENITNIYEINKKNFLINANNSNIVDLYKQLLLIHKSSIGYTKLKQLKYNFNDFYLFTDQIINNKTISKENKKEVINLTLNYLENYNLDLVNLIENNTENKTIYLIYSLMPKSDAVEDFKVQLEQMKSYFENIKI